MGDGRFYDAIAWRPGASPSAGRAGGTKEAWTGFHNGRGASCCRTRRVNCLRKLFEFHVLS